jgi:hypothetical protein
MSTSLETLAVKAAKAFIIPKILVVARCRGIDFRATKAEDHHSPKAFLKENFI